MPNLLAGASQRATTCPESFFTRGVCMGKFVIDKTKNGGVKFNLLAGNGEIIATSEVYNSKAACKNGIQSVIRNAGSEIEDQTEKDFTVLKNPKYEIYKDKKGEFRYRLKASNGQIIAVGEGYSSLAAVKNGVASIKKNAVPDVKIVDQTVEEK